MFQATAELRHDEPREYRSQPHHERGGVEPVFREAVVRHVEPHAREGGDHHQSHQDRNGRREGAEVLHRDADAAIHQSLRDKEEGQREPGDEHELEKPASRELRVGKAGETDDRLAAEEVACLHTNEDREQEGERAQWDSELDGVEGIPRGGRAICRRARRDAKAA